MTSNKLIEELRAAANGAPAGGKITVLNLFGIEHASQLEAENLGELAERAGIGRSFSAELRRGMKLAAFVQLKR
jgi:hypothetical protein